MVGNVLGNENGSVIRSQKLKIHIINQWEGEEEVNYKYSNGKNSPTIGKCNSM